MPDVATLDASTAPEFTPSVDVGRGYPPGYDPSRPRGLPGSEFKLGQSGRGYDPVDVQARVRKRLLESGLPPVAVQGILRRLDKESQFNPGTIGDGGTSYGLMQAHNEPGNKASQRMDDLLAFAKKRETSPDNPELQADFIVHELDTRFPGLKKDLMKATDSGVAYDQFTKVYENPAQTMVMRDASGNIVIGNSELSFSPGRGRGAISMMSPEDFLALAKDDDFPNDRKRKSLAQSLAVGEPIEELPSLDVKHKAGEPTGMVTDADGRHRALAAQEAGLSSIPVEIDGAQDGLTELTGQQGKTLPVSAPRSGDLMSWLVPEAQAQEVVRDKFGGVRVQAAPTPQAPTSQTPTPAHDKFGGVPVGAVQSTPAPVDAPQDEDPYMAWAGDPAQAETAGAIRGLADPVLGAGQWLAEAGTKAGIPGAPWAAQNMLRAVQGLHGFTDPVMARSPVAGEAGEIAGLAPYVLLARRLFGPAAARAVVDRGFWPAVRATAAAGTRGIVPGAGGAVASGQVAPEDVGGEDYWSRKGDRLLPDALFGAGMGTVFNMLGEAGGLYARRVAEQAEQRAMQKQLPVVRDRVIEPLRDALITRTRVARSNITPLMQQFIESPTGQAAIKDELKRAEHDVLGHGKTFNENEFGVVKPPKKPKRPGAPPAPPSKWIIDPTVSGMKDAPSLRFLDAIRQKYDEQIDQLLAKPSEDPDPVRNLAVLRNSRRQFTDLMIQQFPGYEGFLAMTDAYRLINRTLQDEGVGAVKALFKSGSSLARAFGNLGYGSHMHAVANAMQSIVAELRRPGVSTNRLAQLQAARAQLPGMPAMMAEQRANALRRLGRAMGTGASLMGPQVVPGL